MNTLTPHIQTYMAGRVALGSYGPKSLRVVTPRLRSLSDHFGRRPIAHLNRRQIEGWLGHLDQLTVNSRAAYLASCRQFTAWLHSEGFIPADPCSGVPPVRRAKPVPRALNGEEVAAVLAAAGSTRDLAIVWLMVGMGLRRMEVAALRWEHYNERDGFLYIHGKNNKQRELPVPATVAAALSRIRCGTSGPIIRGNRYGRPFTPEDVGKVMTRIMWDAGVKNAAYDGRSGHALRHTAASDILEATGDLVAVQEVLGHADLSTTAIYLRRVSADRLRAAMEGRTYPPAA